jgi:hypothetical protein
MGWELLKIHRNKYRFYLKWKNTGPNHRNKFSPSGTKNSKNPMTKSTVELWKWFGGRLICELKYNPIFQVLIVWTIWRLSLPMLTSNTDLGEFLSICQSLVSIRNICVFAIQQPIRLSTVRNSCCLVPIFRKSRSVHCHFSPSGNRFNI